MKQTYELFREDGITYVTVEKLMSDCLDALNKLKEIKLEALNDTDKQQLRLKIVGLEAIYTFLGGLVTEQDLVELREQHGLQEHGYQQIIH